MGASPNLQWVHTALSQTGAAGVFQTDVLLASPGANWRYRVWGFTANGEETVGTRIRGYLLETITTATRYMAIGMGGERFAAAMLPAGLAIDNNTALSVRWTSAGAAGTAWNIVVYYTVEAI